MKSDSLAGLFPLADLSQLELCNFSLSVYVRILGILCQAVTFLAECQEEYIFLLDCHEFTFLLLLAIGQLLDWEVADLIKKVNIIRLDGV